MHIDTEPTQQLQRAAAAARDAARTCSPAARRRERDAALRAMAAAAARRARRRSWPPTRPTSPPSSAGAAFRDRLALTPAARRSDGRRASRTSPPCPIRSAATLADWTRPNGLRIHRIAAPIGVIGMIYESRPNVGADAAALCLKSGNAVILRGGSDSAHSAARDPRRADRRAARAGLPEAAVQIAPGTDRAYVAAMLAAAGLIDLIIPRGGKSLVRTRAARGARAGARACRGPLPHLRPRRRRPGHGARASLANAKMRRTGICGATETLLIDRSIAPTLLPLLVADLRALGCDFRADAAARAIVPDLPAATAGGFRHRMARRHPVGRRGRRRRRSARPHRPPRQRAHRRHHHRGRSRGRSTSCTASTARSACGTPPPSSATAANSASAPRSASPPAASTPAARSGWSSSPPTATSCAAPARCAPERASRFPCGVGG